MADLFVTNFNRNFTGVSSTAANVIRQQAQAQALHLVGRPLPGCPAPITLAKARQLSRQPAPVIWHVRRNTEMRAAIWSRDVLRLPIRIVFTSAAQRRHSALPRWLISRMDAVIATTEKAAEFVPHVRAVVPHGVDCDLYKPAVDRAAAWQALAHGMGIPGSLGIATVGRIRPEKGTDLFVEAMLRLLPQMPDATALVIGKATSEHRGFLDGLQRKIAAAGLSDRLLFPGEIAPEKLPQILPALSLIMQLPRYEGYGMVPLEAMASGTPFIGSDAGYYQAFSAQGTAGLVVPQGTPETAADAALHLLQDQSRFDAMATRARSVASESFSAAAEAAGIQTVYDQLT